MTIAGQIVAKTVRADIVALTNALDKVPTAHMNTEVRAAWLMAKREAWLQLEAHDRKP